MSEAWSERQMGEKRKERKTLETTVQRAQRPWYLGEMRVCLLIHSFLSPFHEYSLKPFNVPDIFLKILRLKDKLDMVTASESLYVKRRGKHSHRGL